MLRIINEPTAASLAYGLDKKKTETILVWDLGRDVRRLHPGGGRRGVRGQEHGRRHALGGDDYDQRIVQYVADQFQKEQGIDLRKTARPCSASQEACEKAKIELGVVQTEINLPFITADQNVVYTWPSPDAGQVRGADGDITERCVPPAGRPSPMPTRLEDRWGNRWSAPPTCMPVIQQLVRKLTGKENLGVNPDERGVASARAIPC